MRFTSLTPSVVPVHALPSLVQCGRQSGRNLDDNRLRTSRFQRVAPSTVKLGVSRQVVIPKKLHDRLGLKPGDYLEVEEQQGRVVMTPKTLIDSRVHAAFRESMEDFKSGRYAGPFDTAEQATASLHKIAGARRARKASRR